MSPRLLPSLLFFLGTSLFLFHAIQVNATASTEAMLVYSAEDTTSIPKYRIWNGSAWGSELSANSVGGDIRHMVLKYSPTRNEAMLVTLGSTGGLYAQAYNGTGDSWGAAIFLGDVLESPDSGNQTTYFRSFDLEYEQNSGDAMVVYNDGSADPDYRIWDGSSWAAAANLDLPSTTTTDWIELASRQSSDELAYIDLHDGLDVNARRWNGSAWDSMGLSSAFTQTVGSNNKKSIDVAFENSSGDILFLWGGSLATDNYYATYSGGTLSAETLLDNANAGGLTEWVKLANNSASASNQIMFGSLDAGSDLNTFLWSGTGWSSVHSEHSAATEDILDMNFNIVFETHSSNPGDAWLLYGDGSTVTRKLWDSGTSTWSSSTSGDDTANVQMAAHPNNGAVLAALYEDPTSGTDDLAEMNLTGGSQTWSSASSIWGGPVMRNAGATRVAVATQSFDSSTEAMMVYDAQSVTSAPKYRLWDGSALGSELSANSVGGDIRHILIKYAPTRDEAIMIAGGATGAIQAQVWNGTNNTWGNDIILGEHLDSTGDGDTQSLFRAFDLEYEKSSGDAVVVYGDGTADPDYRVWDGTGWSAGSDINLPTTGSPHWIELAARKSADDLGFMVHDFNNDVYGLRWDGSSWSNMGSGSVWDNSGANENKKTVDLAFETNSGDLMFMWGDATATDQYYRSYSGGALGDITLLDNPNAGGVAQWIELAENPVSGSDEIMYGVLDAGADLNTFRWSGTGWGAVDTEHDSATEDVTDFNFDIAYETHGDNANDAWLVWGDGATVSRRLWSNGSWNAASTSGDDTSNVVLSAHPNNGAVLASIYEHFSSATDDLTHMSMTGGSQSWNSPSVVWGGPVWRPLRVNHMSMDGSPYSTTSYEQSGYRFFANANSADVGASMAALNSTGTLGSTGEAFRLRTLLHVSDKALAQSGETFKLQFVNKGVGTCASPSGGTPSSYTDVGTTTAIAFNDNAGVSDGAALTVNANDPTHGSDTVNPQTYEEANNFTNSQSLSGTGSDLMWDFSLIDYGLVADQTYCFRIVKSDGTALDTYTVYPEIRSNASHLSFSISDNSVGFGSLSYLAARYATGDGSGSGSAAEAHTLIASTNATSGYDIYLDGATLMDGAYGINAIGSTASASSAGTEQFGLNLTAAGGDGAPVAPYATASNFALDTAAFPDRVASDLDGDDVSTTYSVTYLANISTATEPGSYSSTLRYLIVANY